MPVPAAGRSKAFHLILVKPSHYDDDGYPIRWLRSAMPANCLAAVYGLAEDARVREVLGAGVDIRVTAIDECNSRVRSASLIRMMRRAGGSGLLALVGVQSNQFPRAVDIARPFRAAGIPVCIGGFHVSGSLAMLAKMPPEMREAAALGISYFAGEAEGGRFDEVLRDAFAGELKPVYDWVGELPALGGAPIPFLPGEHVRRTMGFYSSFDLGRGCPFQCSFCTIINVQGRVSRFRTADDLEAIVRANHAIGIHGFFITDDNFARNRNWEACFDRLIHLKATEGLKVNLQVQVDTLCHRIDGFIDKAAAAGVDQVFIGLENINPDNLAAAKKKQNRITEYRDMLLAWKRHPVVITAGYIIGFPNDTRESVARDIEVIKRELPLDVMYFAYLTPLPGCEDHKRLVEEGAWMDPDLNKYDLDHRVTHHVLMSDEDWDAAYLDAWDRFYSFDHMETVLRRTRALRSNKRFATMRRLATHRLFPRIYGIHPLEGGIARVRHRRDRRPTLKRESPLVFYPREFVRSIANNFGVISTHFRLWLVLRRVWRDERSLAYTDAAISRSASEEGLALFNQTRGGKAVVERERRQRALIERAQQRSTDARMGAKQLHQG
jgi:hypothetical protein